MGTSVVAKIVRRISREATCPDQGRWGAGGEAHSLIDALRHSSAPRKDAAVGRVLALRSLCRLGRHCPGRDAVHAGLPLESLPHALDKIRLALQNVILVPKPLAKADQMARVRLCQDALPGITPPHKGISNYA